MTAAAHTPGPWRADRRSILAEAPGLGLVALAEVHSGAAASLSEADANQSLIAAAPELLQAARDFVAFAEAAGFSIRDGSPLARARDAIVKATGGAA